MAGAGGRSRRRPSWRASASSPARRSARSTPPKFLVAVAASVGFLVGLGGEAISWVLVGALLAGGLVAAPVAAWLVRALSPRILGMGVSAVLIATNADTLFGEAGLAAAEGTMPIVYGALVAAALLALAVALLRRARAAAA